MNILSQILFAYYKQTNIVLSIDAEKITKEPYCYKAPD